MVWTQPSIARWLVSFPRLGAPLGGDPGEQALGWLVGPTLGARQLGFGRDQPPFAGGLEHGGAVALEVRPHALETSDRGVKARELLLNGCYDPTLLGKRCDRN